MTDRKTLRAAAREAMREAKPHPAWVTLAAAAIMAVLMGLSMSISGTFEAYGELFRQALSGQITDAATVAAGSASGFGSFLVLALEIMSVVVSVGYVLYCLRVSRRIRASVGDIFDAFGMFFRAVFIRVLRGLMLFLWEMLFALALSVLLSVMLVLTLATTAEETLMMAVNSPWMLVLSAVLYIPMLVASYFYRLADYFMLDNPGMSCAQCLAMSRMAMRGHKWELFKLDLSFLGWYILSAVPFVALWVQPYVSVTMAGYYDAVAPGFIRELERRIRERPQEPQTTHGYSVPGQKPDDGDK